MALTRRDFVSSIAMGTVGAGLADAAVTGGVEARQPMRAAKLPIIISAGNGIPYIGAG